VATVSVLGQFNAVDRSETRAFSGRVRLTGGGGSFKQRRGVETPELSEFALKSYFGVVGPSCVNTRNLTERTDTHGGQSSDRRTRFIVVTNTGGTSDQRVRRGRTVESRSTSCVGAIYQDTGRPPRDSAYACPTTAAPAHSRRGHIWKLHLHMLCDHSWELRHT
jgi:hypothetical protein